MHFVKYHNLVRQPPEQNEVVLDVQRGEQRLVHRAHAIRREQRPPTTGEPGRGRHACTCAAGDPAQVQDLRVLPGPAVDQLHIRAVAAGKGLQESADPTEQGVSGRSRRQGEVQPAMLVGRLQAQMSKQRQFGLALTHWRLHQQQRRSRGRRQQSVGDALQRTRLDRLLKAKHTAEQLVDLGQFRKQRPVMPPADGRQRRLGTPPGILEIVGEGRLALTQREPLWIGTNPVGNAGQPRQPLNGRLR